MTIESNKTLGGIGAILWFIGLIPFLGVYTGILSFIGFILVLVALYGFAKIYKEQGIFNNFLYSIIACIIGIAVAAVVLVVSVLSTLKDLLYQIYPGWNGNWQNLSGLTANYTNIDLSKVWPLIGGLFAIFVIIVITTIIVAFFIRRSLNILSNKTNVGLFSTAALILLIGACLTIILIGVLLIWIAILLIAIAFFQIKPQPEQPMTTMTTPNQA